DSNRGVTDLQSVALGRLATAPERFWCAGPVEAGSEAPPGFEPGNNGFAIRRLRPLGYGAWSSGTVPANGHRGPFDTLLFIGRLPTGHDSKPTEPGRPTTRLRGGQSLRPIGSPTLPRMLLPPADPVKQRAARQGRSGASVQWWWLEPPEMRPSPVIPA